MNFIHKNRELALLLVIVGVLFGSLNATRSFEPPYRGGADYDNILPVANKLAQKLGVMDISSLDLETAQVLAQEIAWTLSQIRGYCENRSTINLTEQRAGLRGLEEAIRPYRSRLQVYLLFLQKDPLGILAFAFNPGEERFNEASRMLREGQINMEQIVANKELLGFETEAIEVLRLLTGESNDFEHCQSCDGIKQRAGFGVKNCGHRLCADCYAFTIYRDCILCP